MVCLLLEAISASQLPVIIGAPPPTDSEDASAQQMYMDGTLDHEGPPRPPNTAATRIKRSVLPKKGSHNDSGPRIIPVKTKKAEPIVISSSDDSVPRIVPVKTKRDEPIIISSSEDSPPQIIAAKKIKKATAPKNSVPTTTQAGKKSKRDFVPNSSDDEATEDAPQPNEPAGDIIDIAVEEDDYRAEQTRKRKADEPPSPRPAKKVAPNAKLASTWKGKQRAPARKASTKVRTFKSVEFIQSSDSENENDDPDMITVQRKYLPDPMCSITDNVSAASTLLLHDGPPPPSNSGHSSSKRMFSSISLCAAPYYFQLYSGRHVRIRPVWAVPGFHGHKEAHPHLE